MAAVEVLVTPERLEEEAGNLSKSRSDHDASLAQMQGLVDGLLTFWRGEAQQAFANSFSSKKKTFESFSMDLDVFVKFLNDFAREMRFAEENAKRGAEALA